MAQSTLVFDPFSQAFFDDPYEAYRWMRTEAPVYYSEQYDFYALTRHADVAAAFKDPATYSSAYGVDLSMVRAGGPPPDVRLLQFMDPPEHRHMRSVLNKLFTPRAIQAQRPRITAIIDKYLGAIDGDEFDIVRDFTAPFPVEVITTWLGVPDDHVQHARLWTDASMRREPGQIETDEAGKQAVAESVAYYYDCVRQHRAHPRDDLFTLLIDAEITRDDGTTSHLTDIEIVGFAQQLGGAGAETVTKLLASAVYLFAHHPEQWAKLIDDPGKIPAAVEELLRYDNSVQYDVRRSMRDVTLHGVTIPAGKPVFLMLASANRDPEAWTDADTFDIDRNRTEAQNLGLGYGIHSCLGAALARTESAIALEKLLAFMPRYEVDYDRCTRVHMTNVIGWKNVPVRVIR
ncbi:cytochrome [Mycobacterium sp. GA-1199]|uniref:cytochrome P450 n=1 Tax=Mycobacterium sp. GA-1199 TaxID=1772287 RepID=UPI000749FC5C|nr:cytochrome P450 [Mycobacterium sp. GA-1199]KUI46638.1 cytochrome [Mycobacterium sp. GA-1199]